MNALLVPPESYIRRDVESFIRRSYLERYGARISRFPTLLVASTNPFGQINCAAGLRSSVDGFFSEAYFDAPIQTILQQFESTALSRAEIFEVSTLVSDRPGQTAGFIKQIIAHGANAGYRWAFFTVTHRLQTLLNRLGLDLKAIATAEASRISDAADWGTYYQHKPQVYAIDRHKAMNTLRVLKEVA